MHTTPDIINLRTVPYIRRWLQDPNNIYIGRQTKNIEGSKWGNPFRLSKYNYCRETVVTLYEEYITKNQELATSIKELQGKTLGCWCAPEACHGDVLHRLARNTLPTRKMPKKGSKRKGKSKTPKRTSTKMRTRSIKAMKPLMSHWTQFHLQLSVKHQFCWTHKSKLHPRRRKRSCLKQLLMYWRVPLQLHTQTHNLL